MEETLLQRPVDFVEIKARKDTENTFLLNSGVFDDTFFKSAEAFELSSILEQRVKKPKIIKQETINEKDITEFGRLWHEASELESKQENVESIRTYQQCLRLTKDPFVQGKAHVHIGLLYWKTGQYNSSISSGKKAILLLETVGSRGSLFLVEAHMTRARSFLSLGKYENAKISIHAAMELYQNECQRLASADLLNGEMRTIMGEICFAEGDTKLAEEYFQEAIRILANSSYELELAAALISYGRLAGERDDLEQASICFETAIDIYGANKCPVDQGIAMAHSGNIYFRSKQYSEALECLIRAVKLMTPRLCIDHRNVVSAKLIIGMILEKIGENKRALEYYQQCLNSQRKMSADALEVANTLTLIASSLDGMNETEKAIDFEQKAIILQENFFGTTLHPLIAKSLYHLYLFHHRLGDSDKEKAHLSDCLKICQQTELLGTSFEAMVQRKLNKY